MSKKVPDEDDGTHNFMIIITQYTYRVHDDNDDGTNIGNYSIRKE